MRKTHTPTRKIKAKWGLTSHSAAMDLKIQFSGNGVVPRQRFGEIPQLLVSASPEEGAQTVMSHRQVPQGL